eukprot:scaffold101386_cov58-Attheya_sp.AAC.7
MAAQISSNLNIGENSGILQPLEVRRQPCSYSRVSLTILTRLSMLDFSCFEKKEGILRKNKQSQQKPFRESHIITGCCHTW